ncbi:MAG: CDGSH iron-sulfur domain-containing protein [Dehalococcoidia bacterium]
MTDSSDPQETTEPRILVRNNGPFRVYGGIKLVDHEGNEFTVPEGDWYTLCRCGQSKTKPFCDSTHKTCEFDAPSDATRPLE